MNTGLLRPSSSPIANTNSMKNISSVDQIGGYFFYMKRLAVKLSNFRKAYRNYLDVILSVARKRYPVQAILRRNDEMVSLHKYQLSLVAAIESSLLSTYDNNNPIHYNLKEDVITITFSSKAPLSSPRRRTEKTNKNTNVKLTGGMSNGDVISVFLEEEYRRLPVEDRTVVDIGANIGDSPIYFALRGAQRIIALEPFPKNYEIAKRNIEINNLSDKIVLKNAGCRGDSTIATSITIDPHYDGNTMDSLREFDSGVQVPLFSLDQILYENDIPDSSILKMDCEGCEYDSILSASEETLRKFKYIWIEYHYGYKNLKERLEKSGFEVSVTVPKFDPRNLSILRKSHYKKMYVGIISGILR